MEEYYQKVIQLQDKLRKSEEERLNLEIKFNEMLQSIKEEEEAHFKKLRSKYKKFQEEDRRRQQRNDKILEALDRIENRTAIWEARTEKFNEFRKTYQNYLKHNKQIPNTLVDPLMEKERFAFANDEIVEKYMRSLSSQNSKEDDKHFSDTIKPQENYSKLGNINSIPPKAPYTSKNCDLTQLKTTKDHENSLKQNSTLPLLKKEYSTDYEKLKPYLNDSKLYNSQAENNPKIQESPHIIHSNLERLLSENYKSDSIPHHPIQTIPNQPQYKSAEIVRQTLQKISLDGVKSAESHNYTEARQILQDGGNISWPKEDNLSIPLKRRDPGKLLETVTDDFRQNDQHTRQTTEPNVEVKTGLTENLGYSDKLVRRDSNVSVNHKRLNDTAQYSQRKESITQPKLISLQQQKESEYQEDVKKPQNADNKNCTENTKYDATDFNKGGPTLHSDGYEKLDEPCDSSTRFVQPCTENEHTKLQYNQSDQLQNNENAQPVNQYNENDQLHQNYDLTEQAQYERTSQLPVSQYDNNDGYGQVMSQYDQNIQPLEEYDQNSQMQYDENGHLISQYDESGQLFQQYDQTAPLQYDTSGEHIVQYDENGYQQYGQTVQLEYDENGQSTTQYGINGQYEQTNDVQYDENRQPVIQPFQQYDAEQLQYDENGQLVCQYDENGQPLQYYNQTEQVQYDENGQPIYQYDEQGQAMQQYYDENGQPAQYQNFNEDGEANEGIYYNEQNQDQQHLQEDAHQYEEQQNSQSEVNEDVKMQGEEFEANSEPILYPPENNEKHPQIDSMIDPRATTKKALDILETDSESIQQDTKTSNDSDFDFSNA